MTLLTKKTSKSGMPIIIHNLADKKTPISILKSNAKIEIVTDTAKYTATIPKSFYIKRDLKPANIDKENDETINQFGSIFFKKLKEQYHKYIIKNNFDIPEIKDEYKLISKLDLKPYKSLPVGAYFVDVDIEHCYWQTLFNFGVIDKNFYEEYLHPDFKLLRNMAIGYMAKKTSVNIYSGVLTNENKDELIEGLLDNDFHILNDLFTKEKSISCDISIYKRIFDNVRHYSANTMGYAAENLLQGKVIKYVTDGIMFNANNEKVQDVIDYFSSRGFTSVINICKKYNENLYAKKGKFHEFKKGKRK